MKKILAILLALVLIIGTVVLVGCSKKGGDEGQTSAAGGSDTSESADTSEAETTEDAVDAAVVPADYQEITFDNPFYGLKFSATLPAFEELEDVDRTSGTSDYYHRYKLYTDKANYHYATVDVHVGVTDKSTKDYALNNSSSENTETEIGGVYTVKEVKTSPSSGKENNYYILADYLDGYAEARVTVSFLNDYMTDEQWEELTTAFEKYTKFEIAAENGMTTADGRLMDNSNTMAFANPSTIAGQSVSLTQKIGSRSERIYGEYEVDGIKYEIYALGDTTDSVFNARKEKTDEYPAFTSGDYTMYCHIINRFPAVECDIYTEINGIYYNFYLYSHPNLDVDGTKEFAANPDNTQRFADMVNDLLSGAIIDASNYIK